VFALRLNRRKFVKNPNDSIRCKFSIDREFAAKPARGAYPPFRNHTGRGLETGRSPSASIESATGRENPVNAASLAADLRALAFA
jgi:hypothetical protein